MHELGDSWFEYYVAAKNGSLVLLAPRERQVDDK